MVTSTFEDEHGVVHLVTTVMNDEDATDRVIFTACIQDGFWDVCSEDVVIGSRRPNCLGCIAREHASDRPGPRR